MPNFISAIFYVVLQQVSNHVTYREGIGLVSIIQKMRVLLTMHIGTTAYQGHVRVRIAAYVVVYVHIPWLCVCLYDGLLFFYPEEIYRRMKQHFFALGVRPLAEWS